MLRNCLFISPLASKRSICDTKYGLESIESLYIISTQKRGDKELFRFKYGAQRVVLDSKMGGGGRDFSKKRVGKEMFYIFKKGYLGEFFRKITLY